MEQRTHNHTGARERVGRAVDVRGDGIRVGEAAVGYQIGLLGREAELSLASLVGGLMALSLAYLLGGWTAGRIVRYVGRLNGLMTGVWVEAGAVRR